MKNHIIATARTMAEEIGLINITKAELCERAGVSEGSFAVIMGQSFTTFIQGLQTQTHSGPVNRSRAHPSLRKDQILAVAVRVAADIGYYDLTRQEIAAAAGVSTGLVTNYFGTMVKLRRAVMRAAIASEELAVIAQGLACGDPTAKKAPEELKKKAADYLAGV